MNNKSISQALKSDWKFLLIIIIIGIIFHIILWFGWPLHAGADADSYIYYYIDSFNETPVYHQLMAARTPIVPFFFGGLLTLGGPLLTSIVLELLALSSILCIYLIAANWGKWPARTATIIYLFMIPFQLQFHQVSSDGIFAWVILLFCLILLYSIQSRKLKFWIILGVIVAFATLTRPAGLSLILVILVTPFLKLGWKKTLAYMAIFFLSFGILIGGYITYKNIRYQDHSISRGFNITTFYRISRLHDSPFKAENGPYTKKLIRLIENNILTTEVYQKYDVSLDDFLTYKPNSRFTGDMISIVDIKEGWNTNYKLLAQVSLEYIKANPKTFLGIYFKDFIYLLTLKPTVPNSPQKYTTADKIEINENDLPIPTEGELIPYPNQWWLSTRPDGTSPSTVEENNFKEKANSLIKYYADSEGNVKISKIINSLWELFYLPITYFWILGIAGIFLSKGKERIYLLTIILLYIIYIAATLQGTFPWLRYRLPLDPILLILGIAGLFSLIRKILLNKKLS